MRKIANYKRRKRYRRVCAVALAAILFVPLANEMVRRTGAHLLGSLACGEATIAKVRLGFRELKVHQILVWSPNCQHPTLSVNEISVELSLCNGLRHGVWVDSIFIDRPQIQLHFDQAGELLTNLSKLQSADKESSPTTELPFSRLEIRNAQVAIHQPGRQSLIVDGMSLSAEAVSSQLVIDLVLPDLFSGKLQLHSDLNIASLTGNSKLHIDGIHVTSAQLIRLPLVGQDIHVHPWSSSSSLKLEQAGSIADLQSCQIALQIPSLNVSMESGETLLEANTTANLSGGTLTAQTQGRMLDGTFEIEFTGKIPNELRGVMNLSCVGIDTNALPTGLIPENVSSQLDAGMHVAATFSDGLLRIQGTGKTTLADTNLFGVPVSPTTVDVDINGCLDAEGNRSSGMLRATVLSDGISLEQIAAIDVGQVESATGPRIPDFVHPSGQVRAGAQLQIPLATLQDPRTFIANGTINATGVVINDVLVERGSGSFALNDERAAVDFSDISLVDQRNGEQSSVSAIASGGFDDHSSIHAELRVNRLSAKTLARLTEFTDQIVEGEFLARVVAQSTVDQISKPNAWQANALFQARKIEVGGQLLANCEVKCDVANGIASLSQLRGVLAGGTVTGRGQCNLASPFSFHGDGSIVGVDLGQLTSLAGQASQQAVTGRLDLSGTASGDIATNQWQAKGVSVGTELRFGSRSFDDTQLDFSAGPNVISAAAPAAGFLGGDFQLEVSGFATPTEAIQISAAFEDIPLPAIARIAGSQERVEGQLSCEFAITTPPGLANIADVVATASIHSAAVEVNDANFQELQANVTLQRGLAAAQLSAVGFGGKVSADASADVVQLANLDAEQLREFSQLPIDAVATASDVMLQQLWPVIGQQQDLRPLKGHLSATFERNDTDRQNGTVATGEIKLHDLRWDNVLWSNQLSTNLVLREKMLEVRDFGGPFADGRVTGRGKVSLNAARNGSFELSTSRVSLKKALVPLDRRGDLASGQLSMRAQGRLGPRPSGRIMLSMDRGTAGPIALGGLRVPVDWSLDPAAKTVHWRTSNAGVELGGGRVVTNAKGRWNGKLDMSLTSTARRVDTGRIMHGRSNAGGGFLDGTLRLSAKRATDASDFTGKFDATLSDASSLELPVVSDLTEFLTTLPSTTSFDESRIEGSLGNGIVRLDRVMLAAANAQILAEGTATLQGRLNLQVMARTTESGPADKLLELADSPLLMAAPAPIALVARANNALKNRVIHLRIGGTAARPAIRLEPGRQLGQEAIKFFMNQAIAFRNKSDDLSF